MQCRINILLTMLVSHTSHRGVGHRDGVRAPKVGHPLQRHASPPTCVNLTHTERGVVSKEAVRRQTTTGSRNNQSSKYAPQGGSAIALGRDVAPRATPQRLPWSRHRDRPSNSFRREQFNCLGIKKWYPWELRTQPAVGWSKCRIADT